MYIKNREEYCKIPISALNFSTRTFKCLKRANISTLYLLIENIENPEEILRRPASDLDVSVRICNCFIIEYIKTIGQVLDLDPCLTGYI
jgi:DNA-directed RNA polymerase alpha subunit